MRVLAALFLCLIAISPVEAKPSRYPVNEFAGDRYIARPVAQLGRDVAESVGRSVRERRGVRSNKRHPRRHHLPRTRPRNAPGVVAPLSMAYGVQREVGYAFGLPNDVAGFKRSRGAVIGSRPSGCPDRFCGCALSLHIFGRIIPTLNLAANWRRTFAHAAPAAGMVAVRSGHVFKLIAHRGGNVWSVWDANSGRGRIRIHDRSIAGYSIVNPHGGRA